MRELSTSIIAHRYRLIEHVRRGGMSEVYLASDEHTGQQVALKLVSIDEHDYFQRLKNEVRALRQLTHAHILPILDYGETDGLAYLVMPYMRRGNVRERLASGPYSQEEAGIVLAQVASALQAAHERGILHRDIKASNILLDAGEQDAVYLADFGLAKAEGEASDITLTGCLIGTPEYMAPELVDSPESVRSDIYALGVLLYHMLTAQLPFTGPTPIAICWKHIQEMPPLPSTRNPAISPAVEAVILRALDKDPRNRFASASSMAQAYQDALSQSQGSRVSAALLAMPPARVTLRKLAERPTLSALFSKSVRNLRVAPGFNKHVLSLVALLLFALTISFGFLMGHTSSRATSPAATNVDVVEHVLQPLFPPKKAVTTSTPTPPLAPSVPWMHPTEVAAQQDDVLHAVQPRPQPQAGSQDKHHKHHKHSKDGRRDT